MIDFALIMLLISLVFYGALTHLHGWKDFDLSKPIPTPPSARLSLLGTVVMGVLCLRWVTNDAPFLTLLFGGIAIVAMAWSWRIAVRAEANHKDYLRRRSS